MDLRLFYYDVAIWNSVWLCVFNCQFIFPVTSSKKLVLLKPRLRINGKTIKLLSCSKHIVLYNRILSTLRLRLLEFSSTCDTPITEILLLLFSFNSSFVKEHYIQFKTKADFLSKKIEGFLLWEFDITSVLNKVSCTELLQNICTNPTNYA